MAEKLGLRNEIRELKIGQSFTNPKSTAFHTVKYDFKPASVDTNKKATVDVAGNNQVTVTVPHLDGAGVPQTVFKGSQRPYQKECVLIIDRVTGEITLEKLSCNIQVKKTRSEYNKLHLSNNDRLSQNSSNSLDKTSSSTSTSASNSLAQRSQTPPTMVGQRVSHKTKVATSSRQRKPPIGTSTSSQQQPQHQLVPKHSPLHASPSYQRSPMHTKSPKLDVASHPISSSSNGSAIESHSQSTLASLPMIGIDDSDITPTLPSITFSSSQNTNTQHQHNNLPEKNGNTFSVSDNENGVGEITDTSSSSSDSDSDSEEDAVTFSKNVVVNKSNGYSNGTGSLKVDTQILKDDLCLSESGSDSD